MVSLDAMALMLLGERLFAPLAVQQLFHKLRTLEIQELRVLFLTPVKRHAHLPGTREDLRIFNGRLVRDDIRAGARVALHHMQRIAVIVAGAIEPARIVEAFHVYHQRISLPVADRLSHPGVDRRRTVVLEKDVADRSGILVDDYDRARAL